MTPTKLALLFGVFLLAAPLAIAYPPYHDISDTPAAQEEARARKLPLAYLGGFPECFTQASPAPDSNADLSQIALATLQGKAVVIYFDGANMGPVPQLIHAQYHIADDGPLSGGAAWIPPKIVFADPGITKTLGRVSHADLISRGAPAIQDVLDSILKDPTSLDPKPPPPPPQAPAPVPVPVATSVTSDDQTSAVTEAPEFGSLNWGVSLLISRWQFFAAGVGIFVVALIAWAARNL